MIEEENEQGGDLGCCEAIFDAVNVGLTSLFVYHSLCVCVFAGVSCLRKS